VWRGCIDSNKGNHLGGLCVLAAKGKKGTKYSKIDNSIGGEWEFSLFFEHVHNQTKY
jgi:hypothetical protein